MKAQGIRNRCRLSEIPSNVKYEVAPPRMALYIEYAADIYSLYLDYFDPRDIHVYSIDESFLDVTDYLAPNHMDAVTFAKHLMNEIADRFHIPATAGIGTNLYLAKMPKARSSVLTACERLWEHSLFIQRVHRGGAVDDCAFSFVYGHFRDRQGQRRMLSKRSLGRLEQRKTGFYYPVDKTDHFLLAVLVIALHNDMHQAV